MPSLQLVHVPKEGLQFKCMDNYFSGIDGSDIDCVNHCMLSRQEIEVEIGVLNYIVSSTLRFSQYFRVAYKMLIPIAVILFIFGNIMFPQDSIQFIVIASCSISFLLISAMVFAAQDKIYQFAEKKTFDKITLYAANMGSRYKHRGINTNVQFKKCDVLTISSRNSNGELETFIKSPNIEINIQRKITSNDNISTTCNGFDVLSSASNATNNSSSISSSSLSLVVLSTSTSSSNTSSNTDDSSTSSSFSNGTNSNTSNGLNTNTTIAAINDSATGSTTTTTTTKGVRRSHTSNNQQQLSENHSIKLSMGHCPSPIQDKVDKTLVIRLESVTPAENRHFLRSINPFKPRRLLCLHCGTQRGIPSLQQVNCELLCLGCFRPFTDLPVPQHFKNQKQELPLISQEKTINVCIV